MKERISAGTLARTAVLFLALLNQVLSLAGYSPLPIENSDLEEVITVSWTIIAAIISWWKNNSFTASALKGDAVMRKEKNSS